MLVILTSSCPLDNPYFSRFRQISQEISQIAGIITINKKSRFDHLSPSVIAPVYSINSHLNYRSFPGLIISLFASHIYILYSLFCFFRSTQNCSLLIYGRSSFYFILPIIFARFCRIPVFIDHTEWFSLSDFTSRYSLLQFIDDYLFRYLASPLANTHISISFSLSLYLNKIGFRNIRVMLPRFSSHSLLSNSQSQNNFDINFLYSGSLKPSDDPLTLLEAIETFVADPLFAGVSVMLQLSSIPNYLKPLVAKVRKLPQVTVTGRLSIQRRSFLLNSSYCALLTHSNVGGSRYNIPSRYNDYLSSPSIITSYRLISEDYIYHSSYCGYESGSSSSLLIAMKNIFRSSIR